MSSRKRVEISCGSSLRVSPTQGREHKAGPQAPEDEHNRAPARKALLDLANGKIVCPPAGLAAARRRLRRLGSDVSFAKSVAPNMCRTLGDIPEARKRGEPYLRHLFFSALAVCHNFFSSASFEQPGDYRSFLKPVLAEEARVLLSRTYLTCLRLVEALKLQFDRQCSNCSGRLDKPPQRPPL